MATYVILLGPPGSGKGTQAKRVAEKLQIPHVSTGDLFRAMMQRDTPLAREVQEIMARGELVPDETTVRVLKQRLEEDDCQEHGAILDGFPRTIDQAKALDDLLVTWDEAVDITLLMSISEDEVVRRISGRRSCPECGRIYHVEFNPPENNEVCDKDGTALKQREDDRPEVVRDRYKVYLEKTQPLVEFYRERGELKEIDAMRPVDMITPDIVSAIEMVAEE